MASKQLGPEHRHIDVITLLSYYHITHQNYVQYSSDSFSASVGKVQHGFPGVCTGFCTLRVWDQFAVPTTKRRPGKRRAHRAVSSILLTFYRPHTEGGRGGKVSLYLYVHMVFDSMRERRIQCDTIRERGGGGPYRTLKL